MELLAHSRLQHISVSAHGSLVEPDTRCGLCGIPVNVSLNNNLVETRRAFSPVAVGVSSVITVCHSRIYQLRSMLRNFA